MTLLIPEWEIILSQQQWVHKKKKESVQSVHNINRKQDIYCEGTQSFGSVRVVKESTHCNKGPVSGSKFNKLVYP